jgi:ribulose bisphosphate carboxylase small subunit
MSDLGDFNVQKLLDLRLSWKIGPERADQPELRADIEDGMVRGFRVRSAADVLAELIEECAGEVDAS